ncbi:MAG: peptide MFS transporter [Candidatus Nanopelagicales bacterium]
MSAASAVEPEVGPLIKRGPFKGHPNGLPVLFNTELWERFSFYGMRALLVLFLTASVSEGGIGLDAGIAVAIYGTYNALVYILAAPGGWIADRLWGARRSVLVGGIVIAAGHYSMAVPFEATFWLGLLLIAVGTGLLKPNISTIVGMQYRVGDTRRDAGFSLFYMGINIGAFLAPLITGWLQIRFDFHVAFAAAGVGMTIALVFYAMGFRMLGVQASAATNPAGADLARKSVLWLIGGVAGFVVLVALMSLLTGGFQISDVVNLLAVLILITPVAYFVKIFRTPNLTAIERSRVTAFASFIFIGAAMFWMLFDQSGGTLNLFAENHVDRHLFGWEMPTAWLQSLNPMFIIFFAGAFAALWQAWGDRAPSTPVKFSVAVLLIGVSFAAMAIPGRAADNNQSSGVWILVVLYLVQTLAELLLSPVGLSASSQLGPKGMESQMLALWFMATSVGNTIGGQVARFTEGMGLAKQFSVFGWSAIVLGLIMLAFSPRVKKLMAGVH